MPVPANPDDLGVPDRLPPSLPTINPDDWEAEQVFHRINSLIAEPMMLNPCRDTPPPTILDTDSIKQAHQKMLRYTAKTMDPTINPTRVAEVFNDEVIDDDGLLTDRLCQQLKTKPGTTWVVLDGDDTTGHRYVAITGGFGKTGTMRVRSDSTRFTVVNLSPTLTSRVLETGLLAAHPEYSDTQRRQVRYMFDRLRGTVHDSRGTWDEDVIDPWVLIGAAQGWAGAPGQSQVEQARQLADGLAHVDDPEWIRQGIAQLPFRSIHHHTRDGLAEALPQVTIGPFSRTLLPERMEEELRGTSRRAVEAQIHRDYRAYLHTVTGQEHARRDTLRHLRDTAATSASVWQDKKHIPASHVEAARTSVFTTSGLFSHVEIDESVDLDVLAQVEDEYATLAPLLPATTAGRLGFRKTGRHQAIGTYHPHVDAISVDPRAIRSFIHEYCHKIDFTENVAQGRGSRPLSLDEPWITRVAEKIRGNPVFTGLGKTEEYWRTPTEILARSGELFFHRHGPDTSLGPSSEDVSGPQYQVLDEFWDDIEAFWGPRFPALTHPTP